MTCSVVGEKPLKWSPISFCSPILPLSQFELIWQVLLHPSGEREAYPKQTDKLEELLSHPEASEVLQSHFRFEVEYKKYDSKVVASFLWFTFHAF